MNLLTLPRMKLLSRCSTLKFCKINKIKKTNNFIPATNSLKMQRLITWEFFTSLLAKPHSRKSDELQRKKCLSRQEEVNFLVSALYAESEYFLLSCVAKKKKKNFLHRGKGKKLWKLVLHKGPFLPALNRKDGKFGLA